MTNLNPSESALKQRARRLKAKEQKERDELLKIRRLEAETKRIKALKQQQHNDQTDIFSDDWGREPKSNLVDQYPPNKDEYNYNFWNTQQDVNPLDKVSHQTNLKRLFGDNRCED